MTSEKRPAIGADTVRDGTVTDERLFEVLEYVPAAVVVVAPPGKIVYANDAWYRIFGERQFQRASEFPFVDNYNLFVLGTNDRYPRERSPFHRAFLGERTRASDFELRLAGRRLILDVAAAPVYGSDGKVAFAIASIVDVTARAQAEEEYHHLFANAPIGIYRTTPAGDILLANPTLLQMLGYESVHELAAAGGLNAADDRTTFRSILEEKGEVRALEATWRRRDGSFINISENARVVGGTDGRQLFFEGTVEDISQRKEIERELRRGREQYRHLVENASDIIYRVDSHGFFRYVNHTVTKILGFTGEELIGRHFTDLIDPEFREAVLDFYRAQFRGKQPNTYYEFPCIAKNGDRVWIGQNVQPVLTGEWVLGFQAVARDISDRKEMESALARARDSAVESARVKSDFLANMSHEIRTPLNGVVGMTDLLLRMNLTGEQRDAAQTIRTSAEALLTLVDDILDLSKIEAGKLTISKTDFDLDELIDTVTDIFAERAAGKGLKFRAVIDPDVHRHLIGDALRLRQVLTNLVGNAVKFTEVGEVTLRVTAEETSPVAGRRSPGKGSTPQSPATGDRPPATNHPITELSFQVTDTGIGISDADQARLFTPFMQADATTTRRFGGTGLGLAISKQLVDIMEGTMGVSSVPGHGSAFWFRVPFERDLRPEVQQKRGALGGARALLVDTHEHNRLMLRRHLMSAGLEIEEAAPDDAVRVLKEHRFDVAVIEMQLDDTDGITVVRSIRSTPELDQVPIVLVTAIGRRKTDIDFFQSEKIDTWVIKPVRRAQLTSAVAQVVRRESVESPAASPPAADAAKETKRILIVEDNVINQKVAAGQLRLFGFVPDVVSNGAAAIEAVRHQRYDLVLLDCQMPEMDGYDVSLAIRKMESSERRMPIIAVTAHTAESERDKCFAAGMDDFLTKPVSTQRLGEVLSRWLGHRDTEVIDSGKVAGFQQLARANPTFMRDITGLFREDTLVRLHELRDALAGGNAEALSRAAHALKSSSGNIGATRMYSMAAMLEMNAKKHDLDGAARIIDDLAAELDRALEALAAGARDAEE